MSQLKDQDIYSERSPHKETNRDSNREMHNNSSQERQIYPAGYDRQNFVVQKFQNSIETKAQRQARLSGGSCNPYMQQSRQNKLNIVINPFESKPGLRMNQFRENISIDKPKHSVEKSSIGDPH